MLNVFLIYRMRLIVDIAKNLNIKKVCMATNCTQLTIELLSNVAQGKAAHLYDQTGLKENIHGIEIVRPLR